MYVHTPRLLFSPVSNWKITVFARDVVLGFPTLQGRIERYSELTSADFFVQLDKSSWKQLHILWMRQQSKRLCKGRTMMAYYSKQGDRRSCTFIKMLSEWWVSCWYCHLKLSLWCQVANEFRWNFLRVSTYILYYLFSQVIIAPCLRGGGWTLGLGCRGQQLILWWLCWKARICHVAWGVLCTDCGPLVVVGKDLGRGEGRNTSSVTSFCWLE